MLLLNAYLVMNPLYIIHLVPNSNHINVNSKLNYTAVNEQIVCVKQYRRTEFTLAKVLLIVLDYKKVL